MGSWTTDESYEDRDLSPAARWRANWADRAATVGQSPSHARNRVERLAVRQGFVVTVAQARAAGLTSAETRSLVRRGLWSAPHYGTLAVWHPRADPRVRAALAAAAAALVRPQTVVSHASAAILHGLPVRITPTSANLTDRPRRDGGRAGTGVQHATVTPPELTSWYGTPVLNVGRTVADLARHDRASGLIAGDAAVREAMTSAGELRAAAARSTGWTGHTSALWVAIHADRLAESPLESLVRHCLLVAGLPPPELQAVIFDADGWQARVDMLWRAQSVVVEADGLLKYENSRWALRKEKWRQERLERLGLRVVRVLWDDVERHPARTVDRVQSALSRAR